MDPSRDVYDRGIPLHRGGPAVYDYVEPYGLPIGHTPAGVHLPHRPARPLQGATCGKLKVTV